ncbi:MAG TPA: hypothetical protein VHG10_06335 [Glycomyces sp.]|nr:hypothetical protein [Glycomyces sp.]
MQSEGRCLAQGGKSLPTAATTATRQALKGSPGGRATLAVVPLDVGSLEHIQASDAIIAICDSIGFEDRREAMIRLR